MLEMLIFPKTAERRPWEMFFIGIVYASVALLLVSFIFSRDSILKEYGGILLVTFTVIFSLPFMYFLIKQEENKDVQISDEGVLLKEHSKALKALMWLFFGFVVALSFWYLVLPGYNDVNFNAQIKVFCAINSNSGGYSSCVENNGLSVITGQVSRGEVTMAIFANNLYVMIFTLLFSLAFGAGAIFILIWNASVIAAAVGIFANSSLARLPLGILRYIIHGFPEIAAYFVAALAGGILSVAIIRKDLEGHRKIGILRDCLLMVILALVILFIAALLEVYVTPILF